MFKALLLTQADGRTVARFENLDESQLPARAVRVRVRWSTLNYKDALAVTGRGAIVRTWPMVPGIDLAGEVEHSDDPAWQPGDEVVVTGWGLGESHWGGLAQKAALEPGWLLRRPAAYALRDTMAVGTAGVTAALCVRALQRHGVQPGTGPVLVTGAAGGVGSIAVRLLAGLGHEVVASTGRPQEAAWLQDLGAAQVVDRAEFSAPGKPLQKERWAGVVDTVGSHTLANACAATRWNGAVAACGLAQGSDFPSTVMPFILRGVTLYGINSVLVDNAEREQAWALLAEHLPSERLAALTSAVGLTQVPEACEALLAGRVRGRTVVDVDR